MPILQSDFARVLKPAIVFIISTLEGCLLMNANKPVEYLYFFK
jgi:hypothetical protein